MPNWVRGSRFAFELFSLAAFGVTAPLAAAAHDQTYGFAWASQSLSASYIPSPDNAYNDGGIPPQITRSGTGLYSVVFPGLSGLSTSGGNVQVTASSANKNYCKVAGWSGDTVSVACFTIAGSPVDATYTLLYLFPDYHTSSHFAFALADQSANPSYTPDVVHSYNAGLGGAITAARSATGSYSLTWTGISGVGTGGGHIQVSAYGPGNAQCRSAGWGSESASVQCFDPSGTPVDSAYSILYWRPAAGDPGLAFAWADQPGSASYTPSSSYSFNAGTGSVTAIRFSAGSYRVSWGAFDIGINDGNIQVTAYGSNVSCNVESWTSVSAFVRCYDTAGNPVDSYFDVLWLKPMKRPWAQDYAFAWANEPTNPLYTPSTPYSYNRSGGGIQVSRASAGFYNVHFTGFDTFTGGGNVQATAYGSFGGAGPYCKVSSWSPADASVLCFNAAGTQADSYFTVLYVKSPSLPSTVAYAWANNSSSASYTPSTLYSYNPAGGAITATRSGTGAYAMTWAGFGALATGGGHPQVSAYGANNNRCQFTSWAGDSVNVQCYNSAGSPVDSQYSIVYLRPESVDDGLAFAWASDPFTASYTPNPTYSFNAGGGAITAQRFGIGSYRMTFTGYGLRGLGGGDVQVTSLNGGADDRCAVSSWTGETVDVACHNAAGAPIDMYYNVLFIKPLSMPEPGAIAMLGSGAALLGWLARRRRRGD